jgi:hypothetical protein
MPKSRTAQVSRRVFMIQSIVGGVGLACARVALAEMSKLQEGESAAVEHGYKLDAAAVDKKKFPKYEAGQICGTCQLYEDQGQGWGGCALFPNKLVGVNAWCDAWG